MRFEVPQFIDVEEKLFGPFTFKQFVYLAGGAGLMYVSYKVLPFPISWVGMALFGGFAAALTFYKLNNQTFLDILQAWIKYHLKGRLYIWRREPQKVKNIIETPKKPVDIAPVKTFDEKTLTDLAQNLDILDHS